MSAGSPRPAAHLLGVNVHSRTLAVAAATLVVLAAACAPTRAVPEPDSSPSGRVTVAATPPTSATGSLASQAAAKLKLGFTGSRTVKTARARLAGLKVTRPGTTDGYSRALFPHWRDASTWGWPVAPNNSCDARNAALYRDGVNVTLSSSCTNLQGRWLDPYTATWFSKSSDIDIDHMVPLAEAWRSGANTWTTKQRTVFANNPLVEVSVEDSANQSKGDKDPALWKPQNKTSWCLYAKRWIAVKATYKLTVDKAEKAALTGMLGSCG